MEKHRFLEYYSPRMIVCQENMDCENHLKIPFGKYVLANNKPKITSKNSPRLLYCMYLQAIDSAQGGHELLHLQTNSIIKHNHVTPAPITPMIINIVNSISDSKGMHIGIKIANRIGLVLHESAWIAGVDN